MNKSNVQLPQDKLIDTFHLVNLISKAICPNLQEAEGIACIMGKREVVPGKDFSMPYPLLAEDMEIIAPILPLLPRLHGRMTEQEISDFMDVYRNFPRRPSWEPSIVTDVDRSRNGEQQMDIKKLHTDQIRDAVASGEIRAVDANHVPQERMTMGSFLPRDDALKYLTRCGLEAGSVKFSETQFSTTSRSLQSTFPVVDPTLASVHFEANSNGDESRTTPINTSPTASGNNGTQLRWNPENLKKLEAFKAKHTTKVTAEHFGVSQSRVRYVLAKEKGKAMETAQPDVWGGLHNKRKGLRPSP